jgi:glycosyltransferase involved in cell wall biosynthesis
MSQPASQPRLTVLVCTRNGSKTIALALDAIGKQIDVRPDEVELIVVDNNSSDATPQIARDHIAIMPFESRLLAAPKEGKVNALIAGLDAARGEFICIVDDDNIINDRFLRLSMDFLDAHPEVGIVGGVNSLYSENPPEWFERAKDFFACGVPYYVEPAVPVDAYRHISNFGLIAGAGSTFRKVALAPLLANGFFFINETFRGRKMAVTGEDRELCILFHYFGWKMGHDTRMTLRHAVDPSRITPEYLARLCQSIGAGNEGSNLLEAQREGVLGHWKQHWWWRALKRLKRLSRIAPAAVGRGLRGEVVGDGFGEWNMEIGGLRRCLKDRDTLLKKAIVRSQGRWATMQESLAPGKRLPDRAYRQAAPAGLATAPAAASGAGKG